MAARARSSAGWSGEAPPFIVINEEHARNSAVREEMARE
jgi:hypothetical protein